MGSRPGRDRITPATRARIARALVSLLDIDISTAGGRSTARITGEIDLSTVTELESRLEEALAEPALLVIDLREVTFMDSSGLRLMLRLDERQRSSGNRLTVIRGGRRVARVLELTGADEQLDLVSDPAEIDAREQAG